MFSMGAGYHNVSFSSPVPPPSNNHSVMDPSASPSPLGPGDNEHPHGEEVGHMFVHVAEAVIQPIILGLGIVTNILSLLILRKMHMGSVFKVCITSLTLSDLCASIFGFSQIIVEVAAFNGNIPFGYYHPEAIASHVLYFLFMAFMCTSSGLVILIVVIRSVMVAKPMSSRKVLTSGRVKVFCGLVALVTFILFIPTGLNVMWEVCYADFNQNDICPKFVNIQWALKYLYALTIIYGPILICIYITCFLLIRVNLTKANKDAASMMNSEVNSAEIKQRQQQTIKIMHILLAILVLDCICVIPTCIQGVGLIISPNGFVFNKKHALANIIDVICEIFLCCRPTVNFVIYVCMHQEFRKHCAELFGKGRLWALEAFSDLAHGSSRGSNSGGSIHPHGNRVNDDGKRRKSSLNATHLTNIQITPNATPIATPIATPMSGRKSAVTAVTVPLDDVESGEKLGQKNGKEYGVGNSIEMETLLKKPVTLP